MGERVMRTSVGSCQVRFSIEPAFRPTLNSILQDPPRAQEIYRLSVAR
jgi:hypothetical protein